MYRNNNEKVNGIQTFDEYYKNEFLKQLNDNVMLKEEIYKLKQEIISYKMRLEELNSHTNESIQIEIKKLKEENSELKFKIEESFDNNRTMNEEFMKLKREIVYYKSVIEDLKTNRCKTPIENNSSEKNADSVNDISLKLPMNFEFNETNGSNLTSSKAMNFTIADYEAVDIKVEPEITEMNDDEDCDLQTTSIKVNKAQIDTSIHNGKYRIIIKNTGKVSKENRLSCPCCRMAFIKRDAIYHHFKNLHLPKRFSTHVYYMCHICKDEFEQIDELASHLDVIHHDHKIKCSNCGTLFNELHNLTRHLNKKACKYFEDN